MPDLNNKWSVTTTMFGGERRWGVRYEWLGLGCVFSLQVNTAPAIRIIVLGWSFYAGKLLPPPRTLTQTLDNIAQSKGWTRTQ